MLFGSKVYESDRKDDRTVTFWDHILGVERAKRRTMDITREQSDRSLGWGQGILAAAGRSTGQSTNTYIVFPGNVY